MTDETVKEQLERRFGFRNTASFHRFLDDGSLSSAGTVIKAIKKSRQDFPDYNDQWLNDRESELEVALMRRFDDEEMPKAKRSKTDAKLDLETKFGFADTAGFRSMLKEGEIKMATAFLSYIESDPANFPQYLRTWYNWLQARKNELAEAENK